MLPTRTSAWAMRSLVIFARVALLASTTFYASPVSAWSQPAGLSPAEVPPHPDVTLVGGFRQARFGMSEPELLAAIRRDFPTAAPSRRSTHPRERTTILAVMAKELLPGAGEAQIFYILGYTSRRLIQVNIVWSGNDRDAARNEAIVAAANTLRDHIEAQYPASRNAVVANQPVAQNAILVLRVSQADGRMILLLLSGVATAGRPARSLTTPPFTLQLCYIRDHEHPDIFRIGPGRF